MKKKELDLLKKLIEADRLYRTNKEKNGWADPSDRCVEVTDLYDVDRKTANDLIELGLAATYIDYSSASGESRYQPWYICLYSANPYDITYNEEDE